MGQCATKPKSASAHLADQGGTAEAPPSAAARTQPATDADAGGEAPVVSSAASSDVCISHSRVSHDHAPHGAASSDDSRTPAETASSPVSSRPRTHAQPPAAHGAGGLTESTLHELNQASSARRGKPSSTGGTTANTRPTDVPDLPELSDVPEAAEIPRSPGGPQVAGSFASADAASATPPPVAEGLPVVSLHDIAVMEQKQGRRGRQWPSRRGSTTASHASLSAIPENVQITPLHARSERSDSMRPMGGHPVSRLADVQELDVESKSNTGHSRGPSGAGSPGSSSVLTSGDDSFMPHTVESHVEQQLEMLMPLLPHPAPYWRYPNATEATRASMRSASGRHLAPPAQTPPVSGSGGSATLGAPPPATSALVPASAPLPDVSHSMANMFAATGSPRRPSIGGSGSFHARAEGLLERVLTDDSGLQLLRSDVAVGAGDAGCGGEKRTVAAEALTLNGEAVDNETAVLAADLPTLPQGLSQQETIRFALPQPVTGLRCVKKYAVGELAWDQTVMMGDFDAGEHTFTFAKSAVPTGKLTLGRYCMKTVFMDCHGQYLWAGVNAFEVVPSAASAAAAAAET